MAHAEVSLPLSIPHGGQKTDCPLAANCHCDTPWTRFRHYEGRSTSACHENGHCLARQEFPDETQRELVTNPATWKPVHFFC